MQNFINGIIQLKEYILILLLLTFLTILLLKISYHISKRQDKKVSFLHLFFILDRKETATLIAMFSMMCFIISCCFRFQQLNQIHIICFILNFILCLVCSFKLSLALYLFVNTIVCGLALIVLNMLYQYMILMHSPTSFFIVYLCAGISVSVYCIYVFVYEVYMMVKGKEIHYELKG